MSRPRHPLRNIQAKIAAVPMILTAMVVFLGGTIWTIVYSFTSSGLLPRANFVGLAQYDRLWSTPRWLISIENLLIYGVLARFTRSPEYTARKIEQWEAQEVARAAPE